MGRIKYFPSGLAWDEDLLDGEEIASMEVSMKQLVGLQCEREKDSLWKYKCEYGLKETASTAIVNKLNNHARHHEGPIQDWQNGMIYWREECHNQLL